MTLPSLCSAIRSQLYFSQISAWTEQLSTASRSAAAANAHNTRLLAIAGGLQHRLDVHYRIRSFDHTASFTATPTVHNFPDAIVSDTRCVRVSLKSLPRLDAIPTLAVANAPSTVPISALAGSSALEAAVVVDAMTSTAATSALASASALSTTLPSPASMAVPLLRLDDQRPLQHHNYHHHHHHQPPMPQCTETGKHQCSAAFDLLNRGSDEMSGSSSSGGISDSSSPEQSPSASAAPSPLENPLLAYRNRQLQKYRKRLLRREQKKKPSQPSASTSVVAVAQVCAIVPSETAIIAADAAATGQISINSIRPPLYSAAMQLDSAGSAGTTTITTTTTAMSVAVAPSSAASTATAVRHLYQQQQQQQQCVEMKSIGTQTPQPLGAGDDQAQQPLAYPNCDLCGIEMQYVCWNCDKKLFDRWSSRPTSPGQMCTANGSGASSNSSSTGERLMQSIQRTPSFRQLQLSRQRKQQQQQQQADATMSATVHTNYCDQQLTLKPQPISNTCDSRTADGPSDDGRASIDANDCRLCKRQKTAHNYSGGNGINNNNSLACSTSSSFNSIDNNNHINLNNNHRNAGSFLLARLDNEESMPFASCSSSGSFPSSHNSSVDEAATAVVALNGGFHRRTMSESLDSTLPELCAISIDVADISSAAANDSIANNEPRQRLNTVAAATAANHLMMPVCAAGQVCDADLKLYRRAFSEDVLACGCHDDDHVDDKEAFRPKSIQSDRKQPPDSPLAAVQCSPVHAAPLAVFKTPTTPGRSPMLPHPLTISTSHLPQPLQNTCSPSSSMSAMSLDSAASPQLLQSQSRTEPAQPQHLFPTAAVYVDRPVPKVNLNKIFSISPGNVSGPSYATTPCFTFDTVFAAGGSRPTTIGLVRQRSAADAENDEDGATSAAADVEDDSISGPIGPIVVGTVHKSNSAPSFAGAATAAFGGGASACSSSTQQLLSPRFLKMAAIQKRRSRHLSDRSSERSSIGSDELMSDEEFGGGLDNTYMVMLTPNRMVRGVVCKPLPKSYPFGRRALLGEFNIIVFYAKYLYEHH